MNIQDIQEKYELSKEPNVDFWHHKQSGKWILTHDACEKIAHQEGIVLVSREVDNSEAELVRYWITMSMQDDNGETITISSVGEADRNNCRSQYLGCMGEKRGIDRCILKLIRAYQYGISSEVEADDFAKVETGDPVKKNTSPSEKQLDFLQKLADELGIKLTGAKRWSKEKVSSKIDELKNEIQSRESGEYTIKQEELIRS